MKKIPLTAVMLALVFLAVAQAFPLTERINYWQQRLNKELPIGSSRDTVLEWVSRNQFKLLKNQALGELKVRLEKLTPSLQVRQEATSASDGACEQYQILAALKLDAKDRLESALVSSVASCL